MAPSLSKAEYERRSTQLRDQLLEAQFELRKSQSGSVLLIVTGVPAAGRSETVRELLSWLDQKYITVRAFDAPDRYERQRPRHWRYWQALPARGRMAIHFNGWYSDVLLPAAKRDQANARAAERIQRLERMLVKERVALVKVHLHIASKLQHERLGQLRADKLTRWRVTKEDRWQAKHHREVNAIFRRWLKATDQAAAPWHSIDGADEQQRLLAAGTALLEGLRKVLRQTRASERSARPTGTAKSSAPLLASSNSAKLSDAEYEQRLRELQARFALLSRRSSFQKHALVLAFEGLDAAGKGGAIQRLTLALDVRQFSVVPVSAPSPEELLHPYLWRFWRCIPERGSVVIFDRSWYGRVLVERVREITPASDWSRAYEEINEFERQLAEHKIILGKFWLSVSKEEQLRRLERRDENPLKRFKVDPEDWKNHHRYEEYQIAAAEMVKQTSTSYAPWTVIDADMKKYARLKVLQTVCEAIEEQLQ